MSILDWMSRNVFLVLVLGGMILSSLEVIFRAGRRKAWKCPQCGHRGATADD
jgi:hypothetical protein